MPSNWFLGGAGFLQDQNEFSRVIEGIAPDVRQIGFEKQEVTFLNLVAGPINAEVREENQRFFSSGSFPADSPSAWL
jgi:hypothetical protein